MGNIWIDKLYRLSKNDSRIIIGLMSGTSLDGLDISLCKIEGSGLSTKVTSIHFETIAYSNDIKENIRKIFSHRNVDLEQVCLQNEYIGSLHGKLVNEALIRWGVNNEDVDLIASHGQTIYHSPKRLRPNDEFGNGTLQIGDGDHIAFNTQIITLSDFRQKHVAAGGEGAPLSTYGDYLLFNNSAENRIMLNIGGIANFTYLPSVATSENIFSTDVGPGNTIMDHYMQKFFNSPFDIDSFVAKKGVVNGKLLSSLLDHFFFEQSMPKTTGPELFNLKYLENSILKTNSENLSFEDVMATLNMFSAKCISNSIIELYSLNDHPVMYISGGGIHNQLLIENLKMLLNFVEFKSVNELGINPDEKEAILFALLANETVCGSQLKFGNKNHNPSTLMGKISLP